MKRCKTSCNERYYILISAIKIHVCTVDKEKAEDIIINETFICNSTETPLLYVILILEVLIWQKRF